MKIHEMPQNTVRTLYLRCLDSRDIKLPKTVGEVSADSGDWLAEVARKETMRRYWKAAKKDIHLRQSGAKPNTNQYHGDYGRVQIGGRMFTYYPRSEMLVRDDFAMWAESHFDKYCFPTGGARAFGNQSRPHDEVVVRVDPLLHMWKDVRARTMKLSITDMMKPLEWNSEADMREFHTRYVLEITRDQSEGKCYSVSHIQSAMIHGNIAYVSKDYNVAVNAYLDAAAYCLATAQFIQKKHVGKEVENG